MKTGARFLDLTPYFLEIQAENWHPEDFERNTTHTDLNVFLDGLADIARCRVSSVSTFARDVLRYLSTTAGEQIKKRVQDRQIGASPDGILESAILFQTPDAIFDRELSVSTQYVKAKAK